jgi:hypothetical protein
MKRILITTLATLITISSIVNAESGAGTASGSGSGGSFKASGAFSDDDLLGRAIILQYLANQRRDRERDERDYWIKWGEKRLALDREIFKELLEACRIQNAQHRQLPPLP